MSIAVLIQVHEEVRRLAIAGGAVASGDFRLKKLVPVLEQAGTKVPVFARVAHAAQAVVDSTEKTASASLLELATLVHAILYTQGETGLAGDLKPIETTAMNVRFTQVSARVLKPLLEALSSTGSGRFEVVSGAVERGAFKDLRLVLPALNALDDPYPEIAQLIAQKVIPLYGKAVVPELKAKLDLKGRGGHLHRLRLLHALDPEGTRETIKQALDDGSKEIRVVAIECLGTDGDDLGYLLEHARSKARDVRAAALGALARAGTVAKDAVTALKKALEGDDLGLIVDKLAASKNPELLREVNARAEQQLEATLIEKDTKKQGPAITRLQHFARCLIGRSDAEAEAFLLRCFDLAPALTKIKSTPSGMDFNELLVRVLASGTQTMRQRLVAAHKTLTGEMLPPAYFAAREIMSPAAFYDEFVHLLAGIKAKPSKKGGDAERTDALRRTLTLHLGGSYFRAWGGYSVADDFANPPKELDPRWLDAALDAGATVLVCALARPGHKRLHDYLLTQLAAAKLADRGPLIEAMVRIQHPDAADAMIDALKQQAKSIKSGYLYGLDYDLIAALPRSAYPKFEAAMPTLPEKFVDILMESVLELKNKPE